MNWLEAVRRLVSHLRPGGSSHGHTSPHPPTVVGTADASTTDSGHHPVEGHIDIECLDRLPVYPLARVRAAFEAIKGRPDLHWDSVMDGCFGRAHVACAVLGAEFGLECAKAWALSAVKLETGPELLWPPCLPPGRGWMVHVAPAVRAVGDNGVPQWVVMDPTIADGPLPKGSWAEFFRAPGSVVGILPKRLYRVGRFAVVENGLIFENVDLDDDLAMSRAELDRSSTGGR